MNIPPRCRLAMNRIKRGSIFTFKAIVVMGALFAVFVILIKSGAIGFALDKIMPQPMPSYGCVASVTQALVDHLDYTDVKAAYPDVGDEVKQLRAVQVEPLVRAMRQRGAMFSLDCADYAWAHPMYITIRLDHEHIEGFTLWSAGWDGVYGTEDDYAEKVDM